jgi:hypothetical protein
VAAEVDEFLLPRNLSTSGWQDRYLGGFKPQFAQLCRKLTMATSLNANGLIQVDLEPIG